MSPHAIVIGILTALATVGIVVLAVLGQPVPDVLPALAIAGLSAIAGLTVPAGRHTPDQGNQ